MEFGTVLGIDPGLNAGWAVGSVEAKVRVLEWGVIKTRDKPVTGLVKELCRYPIGLAVIEQQYLDEGDRRNPRSVIRTAQLAGRWEEALLLAGIPFTWVLASKWQGKMLKGLVNTYSGKSDDRKRAAKFLVKARWGMDLPSDAADAVLIMAYQAELLWFEKFRKNKKK